MKKILVHACCGVCAFWVGELLKKEFKEVVFYFYNPNIYPKEEWLKREKACLKVAKILGTGFVKEKYNPLKFYEKIKGFEKEKEGGKRCEICFRLRLEKTAIFGKKNGFPIFTTTLSISPYKNAELINKIGKELENKYKIKFKEADFKKKDGFKKTISLAKKYQIYRQNYCGCIFSLKEKLSKLKSS